MPRVAFVTFAILQQLHGHEQVQGFFDRLASVFDAAESSKGFIDRARLEMDWGPRVKPRFYDEAKHPQAATTLSLWADLESVYAFAYHGTHSKALSHRTEWFQQPEWPTYAAWWVGDEHVPTWSEAWQRAEYLYDNGPSPYAFDFRETFDQDGQTYRLQRSIIQDRLPTVP